MSGKLQLFGGGKVHHKKEENTILRVSGICDIMDRPQKRNHPL